MLKWVVTRAPQAMCNNCQAHNDHHWRWHMNTRFADQKLEYENNNNIAAADAKFCYDNTNTTYNHIGSKLADTGTMTLAENRSPKMLSSANLNNTASSFRYFLVNNHSSPLKILRHPPIGDCASHSSSPRRGSGYRRAAQRRQRRRRLSSLHIREPSELASPSYRQADDPANDLSGDHLHVTPLAADRVTSDSVPATQWQEVWDIFAAENEHYNEREIKTPERITSSNHGRTNQLVRRRAVRRRKLTQSCTKDV